jgi:glycosyltransferase involved in cell wall biosynthesis
LPSYFRSLLRARSWIRGRAQSFKPTVIHINTSALLVAGILGRPEGARLVWQVHEIVTRPLLLAWLFRLVPTLAADRVIAVSGAVKAHLAPRRLAVGKVSVVHNAVDPHPFTPISESDAQTVAFIGRLNGWKGADIYVEAVARIAPEFPLARFLIAGGPPPGEEWRVAALRNRIGALGMEDRIEVLGFEDDVPSLIERVAVVAVPSVRPEPFGLVILETMLGGRAVVATAHGGALDLVEPGVTGLLVPPGDSEALAIAIAHILRDRDLGGRIGQAARGTALRNYSPESYLAGIEAVYASLDR